MFDHTKPLISRSNNVTPTSGLGFGAPAAVGTGAFGKKRTSYELSHDLIHTSKADKEKKKLIELQEELAKNQFKFKRQAQHARVKNAFINLEKQGGPSETAPSRRETTGQSDGEYGDETEAAQDSSSMAALPFTGAGKQISAVTSNSQSSKLKHKFNLNLDQMGEDDAAYRQHILGVGPPLHPFSTRNRPLQTIFSTSREPQCKSTHERNNLLNPYFCTAMTKNGSSIDIILEASTV